MHLGRSIIQKFSHPSKVQNLKNFIPRGEVDTPSPTDFVFVATPILPFFLQKNHLTNHNKYFSKVHQKSIWEGPKFKNYPT